MPSLFELKHHVIGHLQNQIVVVVESRNHVAGQAASRLGRFAPSRSLDGQTGLCLEATGGGV